MPDETLKCKDCEKPFVFSEGEAKFYAEQGFTPPKRCKDCRRAKKERQQAGGTR